MLNRLLVVLDLVLVVTAASLGVHLHGIWAEAPPAAAASAPTPAVTAETAPAPPAAVKPSSPSASTFTVIAERNLFSPTRTETAPEPAKPAQTAAAPTPPARPPEKPRLYGVVLGSDGGPRAYLWDPQTKKVFGYKVGDSLADSRIEQINADRVVLRRGSEVFDVLLRDPSKPRPAAAPAFPTAPVPGQVPGAPSPQVPQPLFPGAGTGAEGSSPFAPPGAGMTPGQPAPPPFGSPGAVTPTVPPQRPGTFPFIPGRPQLRMPPGVPGGQTPPAQPQSPGEAGS